MFENVQSTNKHAYTSTTKTSIRHR